MSKLNSNTFTANSIYITPYRGHRQLVESVSATTVPQCNKQRCNTRIQQSKEISGATY